MKKIFITTILAIFNITMTSAQSKFGHVNVQEVIESMPEYIKAKSDVDSLQNQYEAELKMMQEELYNKYAVLEKEKDTLPDNILQRRQKELDEMYQKIQQSHQDSQQTLQKVATEKMQDVTSKVLEVIKSIGQEGGYIYIMDLNNSVSFINTTLSTDLTALVKTKLSLK